MFHCHSTIGLPGTQQKPAIPPTFHLMILTAENDAHHSSILFHTILQQRMPITLKKMLSIILPTELNPIPTERWPPSDILSPFLALNTQNSGGWYRCTCFSSALPLWLGLTTVSCNIMPLTGSMKVWIHTTLSDCRILPHWNLLFSRVSLYRVPNCHFSKQYHWSNLVQKTSEEIAQPKASFYAANYASICILGPFFLTIS